MTDKLTQNTFAVPFAAATLQFSPEEGIKVGGY